MIQKSILLLTLPLSSLQQTMKETVSRYPTMRGYVVRMLEELVTKQIWNMDHGNPKKILWNGFKTCLFELQTDCNPICLRLPLSQLKEILEQRADVLKSFSSFVRELTANRKSTSRVPRAVIDLLSKMES